VVAFDKTGTLTEGRPTLVDATGIALPGGRAELLALAAALQAASEHPLARAVVQAAQAEGVARLQADTPQAVAGRGITGTVAGRTLQLGSSVWMTELGVVDDGLQQQAQAWAAQGRSVAWLAEATQPGETGVPWGCWPSAMRPSRPPRRRCGACTRAVCAWCWSAATTAARSPIWPANWASTITAPRCCPATRPGGG
jgi:hypothetical protein